jgi:cellulose synthase/poly-beta-1,6-N-acetylglucosamine synthase-like glycosyltransferase
VPKRWIERFQVIEYARAFFVGRAAWSKLSALMLISGAFSIFRKDALVAVHGYWTETVGEDMEVVFRLHRHYRALGKPYKILFTPDPIAWTEVPSDMRSLRAQRNRWQRGMLETLWRHRGMAFNPRFGRLGMLGVPYYWVFEAAAPVVEVLGYAALIVSALTGVLFAQFAALFLLLALLYSVLFSQFAAGIESFLLARYPRARDRLILLAASFLEFVGYRQILVFERFIACFQVRRKAKLWGAMRRVGTPEVADL